MRFITKLLISSLAVLVTAYILPGVDVQDYLAAILVALFLAIFNSVLRPILIILTIPVTFLTLGFFLLVINAFIIYLVDRLIDGFAVEGFWWAVGFSIVLSIITGIFERLDGDQHQRRKKDD